MMNHEKVTRMREDERLTELEKVITKGQKTFVEVGLALAEIRELRLYKREYGGFREYCEKKWGWSKSYAYYIIDSAEVVKALPEKVSTYVDNEATARELGKAPADERAGIVEAVVAEGKRVTAAAIKKHLPPPPMVRKDGGTPSPQPSPPMGAREKTTRECSVRASAQQTFWKNSLAAYRWKERK